MPSRMIHYLVADVNGQIEGALCYSKAKLRNGDKEKEILTFGPLCVLPEWQGCGVGGRFIESNVFGELSEEENEELTKNFDAPAKQKFPCQWD